MLDTLTRVDERTEDGIFVGTTRVPFARAGLGGNDGGKVDVRIRSRRGVDNVEGFTINEGKEPAPGRSNVMIMIIAICYS